MNAATEDTGNLAWQMKPDSLDARNERKTDGKGGRAGTSKSRSRSKSLERSRHHNHRSRRSRSREKSRRSKSREKKYRSRSRDHSREKRSKRSGKSRKDRSRERRRSHSKERRSHSKDRRDRKHYPRRGSEERKSRSKSPFRPKIASKAALKFIAQQSKESLAAKLAEVTGTNNAVESEKPSNLPLNLLGLSGATTMTPQLVLQQTMAAMSAQAGLPKYYNPAAVNPLKYAEQMQKRKLLWQSNKEKPETQTKSNSIWAKTHFNQDQDGKMSAKFRKLMGLKEGGAIDSDMPSSSTAINEDAGTGTEVIQKQEALFRDLDQQYETARITTHTQRGVGLGYSSQPQTLIYPK